MEVLSMKKFNITVSRFGFTTIEAKTEEEALNIANKLSTDDFDWEMGFGVTDCIDEEED